MFISNYIYSLITHVWRHAQLDNGLGCFVVSELAKKIAADVQAPPFPPVSLGGNTTSHLDRATFKAAHAKYSISTSAVQWMFWTVRCKKCEARGVECVHGNAPR